MSSFTDIQQQLTIDQGTAGISWTGQAGFAFKDSSGLIYHVDPYLSNLCSQTIGYHRIMPAPVKAKNVITNFIIITHNHKDHLDDESLPAIARANPGASFVAPPSCVSYLQDLGITSGRLIPISRGQQKKTGNIRLKAVTAYHTDDSVGYVLQFDDIVFYFTGDTTYSDDLIAVKEEEPDVMMPCINGRLGCMNIADAARLSGHIQPEFVIPMHYGMFKENTADPDEFVRQAEAYSGITKGVILQQGAWYLFSRDQGFVLNN